MKLLRVQLHNFRAIIDACILLRDYVLLVGPNNAGKSTVIDAIRAFYEKDDYKFKHERDFPAVGASDSESWVELEFVLSDEEWTSLPDDYKLPDNRLRLRKLFVTSQKLTEGKSATGYILGYRTDGQISDSSFFGAKGVQCGKIGDIVFIPAVSKVDEHVKLSGPSALRDLLNDILSDAVESSPAYKKFCVDFGGFANGIKGEKTPDGRSLVGFEAELNTELESWGTEFRLAMNEPKPADIVKSMVGHDLVDREHGKPMAAEQFGSGFQRHFIYSLIQVGSRYVGKKPSKKTKDFAPSMTLLLFEEPEAYLHPPQQEALARSLRALGATPDRQVVCSTHSPSFVSKSSDDIPSIVRMKRSGAVARACQISSEDWTAIIDANQAVNRIAAKWPKLSAKLTEEDWQPEMEAVKHFLWLNAERSCLFFANHVLLVEGASEQAIINKLAGDGRLTGAAGGFYVLDCIGKYNIHRFMHLLVHMGIPHAVIYDDDDNKNEHAELNALIEASRDGALTLNAKSIPGKLEQFLGVPPAKAEHRKPQHLLYLYETGKVAPDKLAAFIALVEECLPKKAAADRKHAVSDTAKSP